MSARWIAVGFSGRKPVCGLLVAAFVAVALADASPAHASCTAPANAIEAENCQPGTPPSAWDIDGVGEGNVHGFATDISVDQG